MNRVIESSHRVRTTVAAAVAAALLAGCASVPLQPTGVADARSKLTRLQGDTALATRAPVALKEAEAAVVSAEQPRTDRDLVAHRVYLADRRIDIARSTAEARLAEEQRATLSAQREGARLDARTREADAAMVDAAAARSASAEQKQMADTARVEADAANVAAGDAQRQANEMRGELEALQAKSTDRGWVLTLGDVLFTTGRADLKSGATANLDRLAQFLVKYPDRTVTIEGHTDSVGSEASNRLLSRQRADAVGSYLAGRGIAAVRLTAIGKGESDHVADNDSASGRQQNRRVEMLISDPPLGAR